LPAACAPGRWARHAALAWLLTIGCQGTDPALPLMLQLSRPAAGESPTALRARAAAGGVALAWLSLPLPLRVGLAQAFVAQAERLRMHRNPLWVDLDAERNDAELRAALSWFLPILTAASALAPGQWQTPDATVRVSAVPRPSAAPRAAPRPPESPAEPPLRADEPTWRRARFAAWALTRALVVQAPSPTVAAQAASALQGRLLAAGSVLGLIVAGAPLDAEPATADATADRAALNSVRTSAAQLLRAGVDTQPLSTELLQALTELPNHPGLPGWLPLPAGQVLVLPRLSAMFADAALRAEVNQSLAAQGLLGQVQVGSAL
jgi:hypothetical protein